MTATTKKKTILTGRQLRRATSPLNFKITRVRAAKSVPGSCSNCVISTSVKMSTSEHGRKIKEIQTLPNGEKVCYIVFADEPKVCYIYSVSDAAIEQAAKFDSKSPSFREGDWVLAPFKSKSKSVMEGIFWHNAQLNAEAGVGITKDNPVPETNTMYVYDAATRDAFVASATAYLTGAATTIPKIPNNTPTLKPGITRKSNPGIPGKNINRQVFPTPAPSVKRDFNS